MDFFTVFVLLEPFEAFVIELSDSCQGFVCATDWPQSVIKFKE